MGIYPNVYLIFSSFLPFHLFHLSNLHFRLYKPFFTERIALAENLARVASLYITHRVSRFV